MTRPIFLNDTTLRDGEQAPGVAFTLAEKLGLAEALAAAGVPEIEAGTPAIGQDEVEAIRAIVSLHLPLRVMAWCRMTAGDLDAALRCGVDAVNLSIPASRLQLAAKLGIDEAEALGRIETFVSRARRHGLFVAVGCEDASRADPAHLQAVAQTAAAAGATRLRLADTVGILDPWSTEHLVRPLAGKPDLAIEFHAHNDLGLATANTLSAIRAGASHVSVTLSGIGERAGNASLEEVAVALRRLSNIHCGIDLSALPGLAAYLGAAAGRSIAVDKPLIGRDVFTHESGLHVAGLLNATETYQGIDPALIGRHHSIALGKHSGTAALAHVLSGQGIALDPQTAPLLLGAVRRLAMRTKKQLSTADLLGLHQNLTHQAPPAPNEMGA